MYKNISESVDQSNSQSIGRIVGRSVSLHNPKHPVTDFAMSKKFNENKGENSFPMQC